MSKRTLDAKLFTIGALAAMAFAVVLPVFAQSTGAIQGTVTDASGAAVPNATITVKDPTHGVDRTLVTDSAGIYYVPSLPVGTYSVEVRAPGLTQTEATGLIVQVGSTVTQNFALSVASSTQKLEVQATAPLVDTSTASLGAVVNEQTVQEIPLNGRHFVDLAQLTTGTVVGPAVGNLTVPLRGQGTFSFNSAGGREDTVNFMVNGINMNDPNNQQITFQPTINTVDEFKIDNSTFSAEYGRNSGTIVNVATRPGVDVWHGEAYEFIRNNDLDARNFSNPTYTTKSGELVPSPQAEFIRNQFGGDGGGALKKDKTFVYLSYEALRQRQGVPSSTTTLSAAQFAQAEATSDPIIQKLLPLIPQANSGTNQFAFTTTAPVNIQQGTVNFSQIFSDTQRLNFYYAIQQDARDEPPATDANSFPNEGDQRNGRRQLLSLNETWVISPTLVNEARLGGNRIHITFDPDNIDNPAAFGINNGISGPVGLPQITVSGAFTFGGINGFPQGRGDTTAVVSDTLSWVHGNHTIKLGGEERRANTDNFSATPGTFTFPSITAFLADEATGFTTTPSNRSNRSYNNALGLFLTDSWKVTRRLTLSLGLRYDWYSTPTEAGGRYVVFDPTNDTLQHVGSDGGPSEVYNQSAKNFEPRVGFAFDPFGKGKTMIRSAYAIMTDQPGFGLVTGLAGNPPYAFPVSFTPSKTTPFVSFSDAYAAAGGSVAPYSVAANYKDAYVQQWNFGIEQQLGESFMVSARYVGSKGTDLNIERNYNQLVNGVHPYLALAADSPIDPGVALSNITVSESDGNSSYNALWVTVEKRLSKGLQFTASESWSKSIDDNSRNYQGIVIQNSYDIEGDRGLSDFDARSRTTISGIYELPFKGNRFKDGWQISLVETTQTGNPLNFHTTNAAFTGQALLRPDVTGPVITGFSPATTGSAVNIQYIQNPSVFVNQGNAFGDLGRNTIIGPGWSDLDLALEKNTRINERFTLQFRADAFDSLNQTNFTNPVTTVGSATLGIITGGTRYAAGDFGTSRQMQMSAKLIF
ncbi:MAG TPA: carboxypeptidase regulatory-like domain-containing protein [Bryobacteraceae bacterium]|nr:carboxypeptidase regulatory-like domain-containing protein [Bryobacteraceae bacterium]